MSRRPTERIRAWHVLLLIGLAVLPYLNALDGEFTLDDAGVIRDNPMIHETSAGRLFTTVYDPGALYRPLTMLSYVANARLAPSPRAYHGVNVALHAAATLGVYMLALVLLGSGTAAIVAGAIFAVHPIHTEAVSSIVGRAELLAATCVLATLVTFVWVEDAPRSRRLLWYAVSATAFAAGLLAKESAFAALGLLALIVWQRRDRRQGPTRSAWMVLLPYALVGLAYLGVRLSVVGALGLPERPPLLDNPLAHTDAPTRVRTAVLVLWQYISLLVAPVHLSADYSFDEIPIVHAIGEPRFLLAACGLIAVGVALASGARRTRTAVTAALFVIIPLILTANLLFPIGTIKAERLLYLPSVGWCLACGALAGVALRTRGHPWVLVLIILVAVYAGRTWTRNWEWRNNLTLFQATVAAAPHSAKAHYNFAVAAQHAGQFDIAMLHYRRALDIYPDYAEAAYGIGHLYALKGVDGGALRWYEDALRHDWRLAKAHLQLGTIRQRLGEYATAEAAFRTGLAIEPANPLLLVNLSAAQLAQGRRWEAVSLLQQLDQLPPEESDISALAQAARQEIEVAAR